MALIQSIKPRNRFRTVAFVTFESEFAPLGGLAAVMRYLPRRMAQLEPGECFTVAPYFSEIVSCNPKRRESIEPTGLSCSVRFGDGYYDVRILSHTDDQGFTTYLLDADDFFNAPCDCGNPPAAEAPCNPYVTPGDPDQLLQDALFFCAAVPKGLLALGKTEDLVLSLQDWQTVSTALTTKTSPAIASVACTLTIHNPYDRPVTDEDIAQIFGRTLPGPTVLTKMMPFVDGPICTVSENFAIELIQDPLHSQVYAPHLQSFFHDRGVAGIDNGLFAARQFPREAITAARVGDLHPLMEEKARRRTAMIEVLQEYKPDEAWGTLDDLDAFDGPVFLMFGRDDPRQKGYDVAAAAIEMMPPGLAKYIFTPIPGDEGLAGLAFLRRLAEERPGEVKVFPFRMAKGYLELQRGSTYLLMSSLYEPFGGATEGYAAGTPVVARATGGLVQQVAPYPGGTTNQVVRRLTDRFHSRDAAPTGFLFREPDMPWDLVVSGWREIVESDYPLGERVAGRRSIPLFNAMAQEAAWALQEATEFYQRRESYGEMIAAGFRMLDRFSWDRAVREYQRLYNAIGSYDSPASSSA